MSPIKILEDALSAGKDFGSLAGRLRDKFKSGTADLQAIYDEAESVVDGAIAKAKDGLDAFKNEVSKVEGDVKSVEDEIPGKATDPVPQPDTPAPVATITTPTPTTTIAVVPASADPAPVQTAAGVVTAAPGTTLHVDDATSTATVVDHATGDATATNAVGTSIPVDPAVVATAVAATADAGVTVAPPEAPANV